MSTKNNEKEFVKEITNMEDDFAQWYTDIILKAELVDYSMVKGCMIIRPYGYELWEKIQNALDSMFKSTGHNISSSPSASLEFVQSLTTT